MPTGSYEMMGLFDKLRWLRWLLSNSGKLTAILAGVDAFQAATSFADKWTAVKLIGNTIMDIIDSAPANLVFAETPEFGEAYWESSLAAHRATALAAGIDWERLMALLPQIAALVQAILKILRGE